MRVALLLPTAYNYTCRIFLSISSCIPSLVAKLSYECLLVAIITLTLVAYMEFAVAYMWSVRVLVPCIDKTARLEVFWEVIIDGTTRVRSREFCYSLWENSKFLATPILSLQTFILSGLLCIGAFVDYLVLSYIGRGLRGLFYSFFMLVFLLYFLSIWVSRIYTYLDWEITSSIGF